MMEKKSLSSFKDSFSQPVPPQEFGPHEKALWHAGKGEWGKAHDIVQGLNDRVSSHIHAFLHRQEGDIANANYWYQKAGTTMPDMNSDREWENIFYSL